MLQPTTTTEQLMFATVRIEADLNAGGTKVGTGFIFKFKMDDQHTLPAIITNKHVVQHTSVGRIRLHLADKRDPGRLSVESSKLLALSGFEQEFVMHPDPTVDLCAMPVGHFFNAARAQGNLVFFRAFDESLIPTQAQLEDLSSVENILMVGYPNGLWDQANNLPLFRRGITATHPAIDYNGTSETVIDAACFPGSSGSPVILYDNGLYTDKRGNINLAPRVFLLGVLRAGPQINAQGGITVQDIPTTQVPVAVTPVMMNLGYIVKSKEIIELGNAVKAWSNQIGESLP